MKDRQTLPLSSYFRILRMPEVIGRSSSYSVLHLQRHPARSVSTLSPDNHGSCHFDNPPHGGVLRSRYILEAACGRLYWGAVAVPGPNNSSTGKAISGNASKKTEAPWRRFRDVLYAFPNGLRKTR